MEIDIDTVGIWIKGCIGVVHHLEWFRTGFVPPLDVALGVTKTIPL